MCSRGTLQKLTVSTAAQRHPVNLRAMRYERQPRAAGRGGARAHVGRAGRGRTVEETPALAWRPVAGERDRAVWQVRVTVMRGGAPATFVASLDPVDGSIVELAREATR